MYITDTFDCCCFSPLIYIGIALVKALIKDRLFYYKYYVCSHAFSLELTDVNTGMEASLGTGRFKYGGFSEIHRYHSVSWNSE